MLLSLAITLRNPIITARGDYNAELLYSPLKIILLVDIAKLDTTIRAFCAFYIDQ